MLLVLRKAGAPASMGSTDVESSSDARKGLRVEGTLEWL